MYRKYHCHTALLVKEKLYDSGISGTSMLLSQVTPEYLTLSIFLVILNVPLFIFGLKRQGLSFTVYSLFAVSVYSLGAWLITDVLPIDVSAASPFAGDDLLLCAIFGGLISGVGSGFFGGEGFIMQKIAGDGLVFIEIDGHCKEYVLQAGESMIVDTGYVAAMSESCSMDIQSVKGVKNVLFGGEGIFHTRITGPGKVYIQSMPVINTAQVLSGYISKGSSGSSDNDSGFTIRLGDK